MVVGSNISIFRKGLLLVCLPIGLQLIILIFSLRLQVSSDEASHWALHTKETIATAEESYRLVSETVAQIRGAIITKNPDFTPDLAVAEIKVLPAIDRLQTMVADNPSQAQRAKEFREIAVRVLDRVTEERDLVRSGRSAEAAGLVGTLMAEHGVEQLHETLSGILNEEQQLDHARLERVESVRRQEYWFVGIAVVATVGLAAVVLSWFTRNVAMRLEMLATNARNLANRKPLVAHVAGKDEIAAVDDAFHAAAGRLAEAEATEKQHRAELEMRAAELANTNAELGRSNNDLRFKTQEIETFVYSVSHDLRSPLVNLQGFSRELARSCEELRGQADDPFMPGETKRRMLDLIDSDILDSVRFIQTAVTRSSNIIDALLRLSRAGRIDYKHVPVDVAAVVTRVVEAMQSSIRDKNATVIVHGLPDAVADATAVEQIFGNLVGNAVNYLNPNRPGRIEIGSLPPDDGDTVKYYVRDNGLGIPAAYLPKMFVAFQRLHGQIAPGEGIGLAMVRRMVDRLGGKIWVESKEGEGSTFYVTLPAATAGSAKSSVPVSSGAVPPADAKAYIGSANEKD